MFEYALQLLLPVILVRYLDPKAFAEYRLLWLLAATGLAIAPFFMPQSLFTFVPAGTAVERRSRVGNTLLFLVVSGAVTSFALAGWNPLLPESMRQLGQYAPAGSLFLALWVVGSLMDVLPTVDGRARWQASATIGIALFRTIVLGAAAVLTGDMSVIVWAMALMALTKVGVIFYYAVWQTNGISVDWQLFTRQLRYAVPFAIANTLFLLRGQADQWVVVSFFTPEEFALISIAAVIGPLSNLVRQPVNNSLLPRIAESFGRGDLRAVESTLSQGYTVVSLILMPFLGWLFSCCYELVEIVYTERYVAASPIMQVYIVGQVASAYAAGHLLAIFRFGRMSAMITVVSLVATVIIGVLGVMTFGLIGAAAGSTVTLVLGELWALWVVAGALGTTPLRVLERSGFIRNASAALIAASAVLIVRDFWPLESGPWLRLFSQSVVFAATWLACVRLLGIDRVIRNLIRAPVVE